MFCRNQLLKISLLVLAILGTSPIGPSAEADEPLLSRFAFGSCAKQDRPQPIWESVVEFRPQFFTFLGDNIYGDTEDMAVLRSKYQQLGNQPGYKKLKATCPIYATWDDHDYGINDGGAEYPKKRESQQVFLDFFEADQDDVRRKREGVYSARVFGPPGRRVQLILLDARYFRSLLKTGFQPGEPGDGYRGKYAPNTDPEATILGEAQWKWLEKQLQVPAELRFIGSGVQVIADEHGSEMWGKWRFGLVFAFDFFFARFLLAGMADSFIEAAVAVLLVTSLAAFDEIGGEVLITVGAGHGAIVTQRVTGSRAGCSFVVIDGLPAGRAGNPLPLVQGDIRRAAVVGVENLFDDLKEICQPAFFEGVADWERAFAFAEAVIRPVTG